MTELTRRGILANAAALSAIALGPLTVHSAAHAAALPANKQAPGYYRYNIGSFEVTAVTDGVRIWPLDNFVRNAAKDEVIAALSAAYLENDKVALPYTPIVINTGRQLVVVDTGAGPAFYEQTKGGLGQFHTNLVAAGIDRNVVDSVIISHFHLDHINGLLTADNKPAFPNAEIAVPAAEWKFWSDDGNMSRAPAGSPVEFNFKNMRRVFGALGNKVRQYEPNKEVVPGISSVATYGHTPGHTSHLITSGSVNVMVQADVTLLPALFVRNPGWHVFLDMDGPMAEQTRRKTYDMAIAEKLLIQGYHHPFPALAHVEKDGAGYQMVPAMWHPTM
jgi:glyoxylase-like metal-dependent hydrolase (beta-lactamase superfamily II)